MTKKKLHENDTNYPFILAFMAAAIDAALVTITAVSLAIVCTTTGAGAGSALLAGTAAAAAAAPFVLPLVITAAVFGLVAIAAASAYLCGNGSPGYYYSTPASNYGYMYGAGITGGFFPSVFDTHSHGHHHGHGHGGGTVHGHW